MVMGTWKESGYRLHINHVVLEQLRHSAWFVYGIGTGLFSRYFETGLVNFMANKFHYLPFSQFMSEGFIQSKFQ